MKGGGPFGVKFALGGLGLRCSARDCKKWTDQCEDCSLKKKKGHCYSRAFFLKRKTRRLKTVTAIVGHFSLNEKAPTKKTVTPIVGHFSLNGKAPTKNTCK